MRKLTHGKLRLLDKMPKPRCLREAQQLLEDLRQFKREEQAIKQELANLAIVRGALEKTDDSDGKIKDAMHVSLDDIENRSEKLRDFFRKKLNFQLLSIGAATFSLYIASMRLIETSLDRIGNVAIALGAGLTCVMISATIRWNWFNLKLSLLNIKFALELNGIDNFISVVNEMRKPDTGKTSDNERVVN